MCTATCGFSCMRCFWTRGLTLTWQEFLATELSLQSLWVWLFIADITDTVGRSKIMCPRTLRESSGVWTWAVWILFCPCYSWALWHFDPAVLCCSEGSATPVEWRQWPICLPFKSGCDWYQALLSYLTQASFGFTCQYFLLENRPRGGVPLKFFH